jgi:glycerol kinase
MEEFKNTFQQKESALVKPAFAGLIAPHCDGRFCITLICAIFKHGGLY